MNLFEIINNTPKRTKYKNSICLQAFFKFIYLYFKIGQTKSIQAILTSMKSNNLNSLNQD